MSEAAVAERWWSRWADRVNPIVVKEVRQGLRARTFWVFFSLMLVASILISLVAVATASPGNAEGRTTFMALWIILAIVWFLVIPFGTYRSLVREREQDTWVLLTLTGLGSKRILRGKIGSALVQAALYGSAAGPFLLVSYYLNGIDLPTIAETLGTSLIWMVFLTCVASCAATFGETRVGRSLVRLGVVVGLFFAAFSGPSAAAQFMIFAPMFGGRADLLWPFVFWIWGMLALGNLFFQAAAARMALATEDYARGPRVALLIAVVGTLIVAGAAALFSSTSDSKVYFVTADVSLVALLWVAGLFMVSEPAAVHPVHRNRVGWRLFRPGPLNGFRFVLALAGALTAICAVLVAILPSSNLRSEMVFATVLPVLYLSIYLAVPLILVCLLAKGRFRPMLTRTVAFGLLAAGSILPPIFAALSGADVDAIAYNFFDPVVGMVKAYAPHGFPAALMSVLLVMALVVIGSADYLLGDRERKESPRPDARATGERVA